MVIKCIDIHRVVDLIKQQIRLKLADGNMDCYVRAETHGMLDALKIITDSPIVAEIKVDLIKEK